VTAITAMELAIDLAVRHDGHWARLRGRGAGALSDSSQMQQSERLPTVTFSD